jgi:hypothetical protein
MYINIIKQSATLTLTSNTYRSNTATSTSSAGGALYIDLSGALTSASVSILSTTF